jgi:RNA polymerase sigma factor (TIGR02999 family)
VLLDRVRDGDPDALDRLIPLVYDELRRVAHNWLRGERADISLGTTELVHETYVRLVDQTRVEWRDRVHFFGVASSLMRRILVDAARKRSRAKRGGGWARIDLEAADLPVEDEVERLLALDEALDKLGRVDERLRRVVECRYFGGLTEDETGEVLGVTSRTVQRDWVKAKALLYSELSLRTPVASPVREG